MKKNYVLLIILGIFLILPCTKVNAKNVNVGINFDANEHFNYFYEMKNNTPFYQLLVSKGDELLPYLNTFRNAGSYNSYIIHLMYYSDYCSIMTCDDNISAKYVILIYNHVNTSFSFPLSFGVTGDTFKYGLGDSAIQSYIYFFDEDSNYISSVFFTQDNNVDKLMESFKYTFDDKSKESSENFSYFISSTYMVKRKTNNTTFNSIIGESVNDYVVSDLYIENTNYIIDDNENYSSFKRFFRTLFGSSEKYDTTDSNLDYFRNFKVISSGELPSLYSMISYNSSAVVVPSGYTSVEIVNSGGFLIPKVNTKNKNSVVYALTSGYPSINIRYWKFNTEDNTIAYMGDDLIQNYTSQYSGVVSKFKLINNTEKLTGNFYEYMYQLGYQYVDGFYDSPLKYTYTIYYDPNVYTYVHFNTSTDLTSKIPGTDTSFTISAEDIINTSDSTGVSIDIFAPIDEQIETGKKYSELDIDYEHSYSVLQAIKDSVRIVSFLKVSISSILSLITVFFVALPTEIRLLLTFCLSMGIIIIFVKIIRG